VIVHRLPRNTRGFGNVAHADAPAAVLFRQPSRSLKNTRPGFRFAT